jgi:putative tryptophan/tyrosine transport system substrate-binding protein
LSKVGAVSSLGAKAMRRRHFIKLIAGSAAGWPLTLRAQPAAAKRRVGWLDIFREDDPFVQGRAEAVREDLAKAGWTVGRNLQIDYRWGVTTPELAQPLSGELLSLSPDVILSVGSSGVKALKQATSKVPIVFVLVAEPVDQGIVQSLDHPGANITGFAYLERTIGAKWFGLLMEVAPQVKRVAYIFSPKAAPYAHFYYESAVAAAEHRDVRVEITPVTEQAEIEHAFANIGSDGGMIVNPDPFMNGNIGLVIDLAARHRVPAIYGTAGDLAKFGALIVYNLDLLDHYRQGGKYVERILTGENPADLPVQQPTKFQFAINLKTAKTLGLTVPQPLLIGADEVIE